MSPAPAAHKSASARTLTRPNPDFPEKLPVERPAEETAEQTAEQTAEETAEQTAEQKCGKPARHGKPCIKVAGHPGECAIRAYSTRQTSVATTLSADFLQTAEAVPTADAPVIAAKGERDDLQKALDAAVKTQHEAWVSAGKPISFSAAIAAQVALRYFIAPTDYDAIKTKLRNAATFHGLAVAVAPIRKHDDGRYMLYWYARDKSEQKAGSKSA